MNSRGKPLTTFEVFKADFESIIQSADPDRHQHLVESIDGVWADLLWEYEKRAASDYKIDDEFERYLTFIIEICEWRDGKLDRKWHDKQARRLWPIEERARLAFADPDNEHADRNRDFFFHAFDTWIGADPSPVSGSSRPEPSSQAVHAGGVRKDRFRFLHNSKPLRWLHRPVWVRLHTKTLLS
jgi:hypothetical protein